MSGFRCYCARLIRQDLELGEVLHGPVEGSRLFRPGAAGGKARRVVFN